MKEERRKKKKRKEGKRKEGICARTCVCVCALPIGKLRDNDRRD